jgi:DNA polymerase-3 subunit gamma/tau
MEIIGQLERIVAAEKIEVEKEVLVAIAKSSDGSLRDAESILDQLISFSKDKLSIKDIVSMLGIVEQEMLFEITEKIIQKDAKAALTMFSEIISQGKDIGVFLLNLIEHFRNLMVAKITQADSQLIDLPVEICQRLAEQSQAFSLEEIFSAFSALINTQEISKRLDSLRIPLEITLVKLAHDKRDSNQNLPFSKSSYVTKHASPIKEKHTEQPVEKEDNPVPLGPVQSASLDNLKSVWKNIIDNLAKIKMSVATYLDEGEPTRLENNILTVSFPVNYSLHKESLERKENKAIIEKTASGLLNTNIKVNFTLSKEMVKKDNSEADPFIRSALQTFNGRVVKGQ